MIYFSFFLFFYYQQKIEKPFLAAVESTLGDRYTQNIENIYKVTIKFIIETLITGFESANKNSLPSAGQASHNNDHSKS